MIPRRRLLGGAVGALGLLAPPPVRAASPRWGTVPKAALRYRDHPLGEKSCVTCAHFRHAATPGGAAHCTVIAGVVQPDGYCIAWQDRNPSNSC
ncbi:MAG: hypothetical protein ACP5NP_00740 [Acetobacteraceae bacterium]